MFENHELGSHQAIGNAKRQQPRLSIFGCVLCLAERDCFLEDLPSEVLEVASFPCARKLRPLLS